ncbi:hypothetical protein NQP46_15755 [Streptomyces albus]|nr:hypothetical protein NQP46_15755 [Streptomyces albus]
MLAEDQELLAEEEAYQGAVRESTPLGRPVEPEVNITYAASSGVARRGRSSSPYAASGPSASPGPGRTTTVGARAAARPAPAASVTTTPVPAWRAISASRGPGKAGSIGAQPAPVLSTASRPVTSSGPRSRHTPTRSPGPTPCPARWRASRLARALSSP